MVAAFYFLVVVFHVMVVLYRMARVVSAQKKKFFFHGCRPQAIVDFLVSDGGCKHHTVPRTRCTRNIFSRVVQQ